MSQFTSSGSPGTDHHSGWENIAAGQTITIEANKQMVVFGVFINDGILNIDGQLILEP